MFGDWIPDDWIQDVFNACLAAPQHRYLFLTKNPKRLCCLANSNMLPKLDNFWYGTTVTNRGQRYFYAWGYNNFLSIEPLLEHLKSELGSFGGTKWFIIGAETGNRKGKIIPQKEWVDNICELANITRASVFMKNSLIPVIGEENIRREFPWGVKK